MLYEIRLIRSNLRSTGYKPIPCSPLPEGPQTCGLDSTLMPGRRIPRFVPLHSRMTGGFGRQLCLAVSAAPGNTCISDPLADTYSAFCVLCWLKVDDIRQRAGAGGCLRPGTCGGPGSFLARPCSRTERAATTACTPHGRNRILLSEAVTLLKLLLQERAEESKMDRREARKRCLRCRLEFFMLCRRKMPGPRKPQRPAAAAASLQLQVCTLRLVYPVEVGRLSHTTVASSVCSTNCSTAALFRRQNLHVVLEYPGMPEHSVCVVQALCCARGYGIKLNIVQKSVPGASQKLRNQGESLIRFSL